MKKNYFLKICIVPLCTMSFQLAAQLSGAYTINSGLATGGSNFQTFGAFASALNTQGVSAPVTVNVFGGPFIEQVTFTQATGVSATNTITINGNNCLVDFTGSSGAPHTIWLNGSDRMYFHDLNVKGNGSYAMPLVLSAGANDNLFALCTFSCPANGNSSSQIPVNISGSNMNYYTAGANHRNTFRGCEMFSGYFNVVVYGTTGTQPTGNKFLDCKFLDFYVYGPYIQYAKDIVVKGCVVERLTRTAFTSCYAMTFGSCEGTLCEGNTIQKLFEMNTTGNYYTIGIQAYNNPAGSGANPNRIQNNILRDIRSNGTLYGMQCYSFDGLIRHNTISLDHTAATTGNQTFGIYTYGQSGLPTTVQNNLITLTRGGSGLKVGIYVPLTGNITSSHNNVYLSATNAHFGYYSNTNQTLAGMQSYGLDMNSMSVNPMYTNLATGNLLPTNVAMNNLGTPVGVATDHQSMIRSGTTPDIGALEFLSVACSGTPSPGSVVTPTYQICPGESVLMMLSNFSSDLGVTYQWHYSTQSSVGQWFPIQGATSVLHTADNIGVTTWYQAVVTCTNSNQSISVVGQVTVAGTTTNTAPYYEDFEGISRTNTFPNCSWYSDDLGGTVKTYTSANNQNRVPRSGSKFASFYYAPGATRAAYTNGIWLDAGITYSASVWYTTEYYGYNNWTDLSILVGPSQSATGQQTVASTNGPAVSVIYKPLSNTFTVASSGLYYVAVRGTVTGSGAQYLSWDDLAIEIPCSLNAPAMSVTSNQNTVCVNSPVTLQASGADTYSWSTGDQGSPVTISPFFPGVITYYVTGTHTLSGCQLTLPQTIVVNPAPSLHILANPPVICEGSTAVLTAFGAANYIWTNNQSGPVNPVSPANTATFAVVGTNAFQCQGTAVVQVIVNPSPIITATHPSVICKGDLVPITGNGGISYVIVSPTSHNSSNPAYVSPASSTQYTVTGTDANGCKNFTLADITVNDCVGLGAQSPATGMQVYPNPTTGKIMVGLTGPGIRRMDVIDVTGRLLMTVMADTALAEVDLSDLSMGVYYLKVSGETGTNTVRVIRN